MEHLEELDSAVLDAIRGADGAGRVRDLWPEVISRLPPRFVDESRQQYVQFAVRGWLRHDSDDAARNPSRAMAALDVLAVLFDE